MASGSGAGASASASASWPPAHGYETAAGGGGSASARRDYRLLHQLVCLSGLDMHKRQLIGFTELTVAPLCDTLRTVKLNCGNDVNVASVTINDVEVPHERVDRAARLRAAVATCERSAKCLAHVLYSNAVDYDNGDAQLLITIPDWDDELRSAVANGELLKVGIDFVVHKPVVGLHFVTPSAGASVARSPWPSVVSPVAHAALPSGSHVYTSRVSRAAAAGTSHWLPCVDAPAELCLWRLEVTVDARLTAVASGELTETVVSADRQRTTYHYVLATPTSAVNIGFAIGTFESVTCADIAELSSYCLPQLKPLLGHTLARIGKIVEFFEELLNYRFPYPSYKIVFVDQLSDDTASYAGVTLVSLCYLYHRAILETVQHTRTVLANGVVAQYFGCMVTQHAWLDVWVVRGLARYLTMLYLEHAFGTSEYNCQTYSSMRAVCDYERRHGPIMLRPLAAETRARDQLHFDPRASDACVSAHCDAMAKKAHLVLRMLERRLGKEPFFHVLHQLLAVAGRAAAAKDQPAMWGSLLVSTDSLFATVSSVTGQELPTFLEHWIYGGGHAHFHATYAYNRKRSSLELELVQDEKADKGRLFYVGPVNVCVQELDGFYTHTVHVDERRAKLDLPVSTKGRKLKKKKVPIAIGEEVDIDLGNVDTDCPILWVRIDADMQLIRVLDLSQIESAWQLALRHDRDAVAQMHAVDVLQRFTSAQTIDCLSDTLANNKVFYRVRVRCALALATASNEQSALGGGVDLLSAGALPQSPIMQYWERTFATCGAVRLPRELNFAATPDKLILYFMLQAVTQSLASLRAPNGEVRDDALNTLFNMLYYMDNAKNRYSVDHYRATVLNALSQAASLVRRPAALPTRRSQLPNTVSRVLDELVLAMNTEKLQPTYHRVVLSACLRCVYMLQRAGFLAVDPQLFWHYFDPSQFIKVRQTAADCLCDVAVCYCAMGDCGKAAQLITALLQECLADADPSLRSHVLRSINVRLALIATGPNAPTTVHIDFSRIVDAVCKAIGNAGEDVRTRLDLFELFCAIKPIGSVEQLPSVAAAAGPQTVGPVSSAAPAAASESVHLLSAPMHGPMLLSADQLPLDAL